MKTLVRHFALFALISLILSPLAVSHASPPLDYEQWKRDHTRPAAKLTQEESPEYIVRVIYFLPSDREPDPDVDAKLDKLMKDIQQFFAGVMQAYGFGRKTFRLETDATGKVVVHHVNGQFNDAFYKGSWSSSTDEIGALFDLSGKNIYFIALDISHTISSGPTELAGFAWGMTSLGGNAIMPLDQVYKFPGVVVHELVHTFGLPHDTRSDAKVTLTDNYFSGRMTNTPCAAEWLDVHRYFNASQKAFNENTSVQMLPPSLASPPNNFRFRFEVTDSDGLHQARLFAAGIDGMTACKQLDGTNATVEFVTNLVLPTSDYIFLTVMDANGNFTHYSFPIDIIPLLPPPEVVSIPDANLEAALRRTLNLSSDQPLTSHAMGSIRVLIAHGKSSSQITDLTGLEHAFNLVFLDIRENKISDLRPLAALPQLKGLEGSDNQISDITPLAKVTFLKSLSLIRNQISDISPLAELEYLDQLLLHGNQISDISPLARRTLMSDLSLSDNQISDVSPLVRMTRLLHLSLWRNPIADTSPLHELRRRNPNVQIDIDIGEPPSPPHALEKISGDEQQGPVGAALAEPFVVSVLDQNGVIAWAVVTFSVTAGGGTLSATTVTTDANGRARSTLTLGSEPGTNTVEATVEGLGTETFTAIGQATTDSDSEEEDGEEDSELAFDFAGVEDQEYTAGTAISALVLPEATGGEGEITYSVSELPDGLSFDAATRTLSGTPEAATDGAIEITYTAEDNIGGTASLTFFITVNSPLSFGDLFGLFN